MDVFCCGGVIALSRDLVYFVVIRFKYAVSTLWTLQVPLRWCFITHNFRMKTFIAVVFGGFRFILLYIYIYMHLSIDVSITLDDYH